MGKKKKGGYESAVSSIWDVMFNSKSKKPGSLKPKKIKEGSEFGKAVGDIITAPAYFLGKEMQKNVTGPIEESSIFGITGAAADRYGNDGKVELKVKVKNLPQLINDPDALVEEMMNNLQQRSKKDGFLTFGRNMDVAVSTFQGISSGMSPLEAFKFGMTNNAYTGLNADKNSDRNIAEVAVLESGGSLDGLSLTDKDVIAKKAWKAVEDGKMRQKYGPMWFKYAGMADGTSLTHDIYKDLKPAEKDAIASKMKAETEKEFRSNLSKAGIDTRYHDDLLASFIAEGRRYDSDDLRNTRFYSYLGNEGKTASGMEYSPGMYRDTYARVHDEKIKLIQKDLAAEMGKASPDANKIAKLLKQIDNNTSKAGTARYAQNVLGYDSKMAGTSYVQGADVLGRDGDKISDQLVAMRSELVKLSSVVDITKELAEIDSIIGSIKKGTGSNATALNPGNWRDIGKYVNNPGLLLDATANNMERIAHRTGAIAIAAQIKDFEYRRSALLTKGITTPEDQAELSVLEHQMKALSHEGKFLNPRKFQMKEWQLGMGRITQYMTMWRSINSGEMFGDLATGKFFTDGVFASAVLADPDKGLGVDIELFEKDAKGKYLKQNLYFFYRNDKKYKSKWWREQTALYYLLPQNMMKTVAWDGGGFKYLMSNEYDKFLEDFKPKVAALWDNDPAFKTAMTALMGTGTYNAADAAAFAEEHAAEVMEKLGTNPVIAAYRKLYENNVLKWKKLVDFFSINDRAFTKMKDTLIKNGLKKFGLDKIIRGTLTLGGRIGGEWAKLVGDMLGSKIGLQQLLTKGVQMLLEPLLAATGPFGWLATIAIQWFAPAIVNKILKPIVSVSVHFMSFALKTIGILMILFFLCCCTIMNGILFWGAPTAIISPLEAAGESTNPETLVSYLSTTPGTGNIPISNIKGKCPFKAGAICTQLPNNDPSCSHGSLYQNYGMKPIDVVTQDYFYAPGECEVLSAETQGSLNPQCGGRIEVVCTMEGQKVNFILVHVEKAFTSTRISQGKPIAKMETCGTNGYFCCDGCCSSGAHYHVSASTPKGQLNTDKLFNGFCGGSYCSLQIGCGADFPLP
jgi:hypothetical protein